MFMIYEKNAKGIFWFMFMIYEKNAKGIRYNLAATFDLVLDTSGNGNNSDIFHIPGSSDTEIYDNNSIPRDEDKLYQ